MKKAKWVNTVKESLKLDEIHKAFENHKSLELRAVFLDISKAFDKVWHNGILFKLKQNGVSGKLLKKN